MRFLKTSDISKAIVNLACLLLLFGATAETSAQASPSPLAAGNTSISTMRDSFVQANPSVSWLKTSDLRDANNNPLPAVFNPAVVKGASPYGNMTPPVLAAAMSVPTTMLGAGMYTSGMNQLGGFSGQWPSDLKSYLYQMQGANYLAGMVQYPPNVANQAKAATLGQAQAMSNAMGDVSKSQSASAMSYCSGYLQNFTVDEGNRWNKIRNGLFVPMAFLLLLPGAILTQVKAMVTSGNPVLSASGDLDYINPLEGILRSVVAVFLIPGTYLIVNYGIDFSNCVTNSIASTYQTLMNSNMYDDALSSEVNAFPVRNPNENQNAGQPATWPTSAIKSVADFEKNYISNTGANKTDEAMPSGAVAAREITFGANAALTSSWNVLCAFQMAYLAFLFFVGPIVAALWVWPMDHFRQALPNWIEGVLTLCFWSMFWNTTILLMACFKGVDQGGTGTMITSALNFLAVSSVKFAFDFAGLVQAAGQEAARKAVDNSKSGGGGAKRGSAGQAGKQAKGGSQQRIGAGSSGGGSAGGGSAGGSGGGGGGGTSGDDADTSVQPAGLTSQGLVQAPTLSSATGADFRGGNGAPSSADVALPPLALASMRNGKDIRSESLQLGNYSLSHGLDEQGKQVGFLKDSRGNIIAHLPQDVKNGQSVPTTDGSKLTYHSDGANASYSLTDNSGQKFSAQLAPLTVGESGATGAISGMIGPAGQGAQNSLALRSGLGTLLLENNGNSLLMPRPDGKGYDTFNIAAGNSQASFALPQDRTLSMSQQPGGGQEISIQSGAAGGSETFSVIPGANGGYEIGRTVDGNTVGYTQVANDGGSTHYYTYGADGRVSDIDSVSPNNTSSSYFDPNSGLLLGNVATTYQDNGNSNTAYYDANGTLTASTEQLYKDGGSLNVVYDGAGQPVSSQGLSVTADGGYALECAKYDQGVVTNAQVHNYDRNANLIASTPVDLAKAAVDSTALLTTVGLLIGASAVAQRSNSETPIQSETVTPAMVMPNTLASYTTASNPTTSNPTASNPTTSITSEPNTASSREVYYSAQALDHGIVETNSESEVPRDTSALIASAGLVGTTGSLAAGSANPASTPASTNLRSRSAVPVNAQSVSSSQGEITLAHRAGSNAVQGTVAAAFLGRSNGTSSTNIEAGDVIKVEHLSTSMNTTAHSNDQAFAQHNSALTFNATGPAPDPKMSPLQFALNLGAQSQATKNNPSFSKLGSQTNLSVKVPPSDLSKLKAPVTDNSAIYPTISVNQQQLAIDGSDRSRSKTISDVLKTMNSSATVAEALASAHVNYNLVSSLLRSGRSHQAQQLLNVVLRDIEIIKYVEEARPLIEAYIELLTRHHLNAEAFENCLQSDVKEAPSSSNPW